MFTYVEFKTFCEAINNNSNTNWNIVVFITSSIQCDSRGLLGNPVDNEDNAFTVPIFEHKSQTTKIKLAQG